MVIKLSQHDIDRLQDGETKSLMTNDGIHVTIGRVEQEKSSVATR
jgi:hypothetical protein